MMKPAVITADELARRSQTEVTDGSQETVVQQAGKETLEVSVLGSTAPRCPPALADDLHALINTGNGTAGEKSFSEEFVWLLSVAPLQDYMAPPSPIPKKGEWKWDPSC